VRDVTEVKVFLSFVMAISPLTPALSPTGERELLFNIETLLL